MSSGTISFQGRIVDDTVPKLDLVEIKYEPTEKFPWRAYSKATNEFICGLATEDQVKRAIEAMDYSVLYR